ncbi:MAG: 2-hydroxyacyl-CoA dehydratase, partial [Bdellovibrionales bacterium]|nr:2-hydroxyacyl-CoA dehydratase [Bdellovibrionales bacterium]
RIESSKVLKENLKEYFQEFFPQEGPKPKVAWCTSVGPAELLVSLGFKVYYPENHGALLGATRSAEKYIPKANASGYSPEICSYLTSDIGAYQMDETPLKEAYGIPSVPPPDVLIYNTNQCREVQDWFAYYAREFKVPSLGVFSPWKVDELNSEQVGYVARQIEAMIPELEKISGHKFDFDRLKEVVSLSRKTSDLWLQFLNTARNRPSPITFFDGCIQMAPAVVLRGTQVAVDYYELLNKEMADHVSRGEAAVPGEQVRLYWEGMPVWGKLRFFSDLLSGFKANAVASTYCDSWIFTDFDASDPFNSMARAYTKIFINRSENKKEEVLAAMAKEYEVDGIIYHDAKTCPYNSNSRFGLPQRITDKYGIPHLIFDGDVNDLRCFSEEQTITSVESFVDQIKEAKRG